MNLGREEGPVAETRGEGSEDGGDHRGAGHEGPAAGEFECGE